MNTIHNSFVVDCRSCGELVYCLDEITTDPYTEPDLFTKQSALHANRLPLAIHQKLHNFYSHGNEEGILLLKNLPQDIKIDQVPTPTMDAIQKPYISEFILAMIGSFLGQVVGYKQINNGILFHNIVPKPGMEQQQSYAGSKVELMLHTEQHFHPHSPDYILLYCLRFQKNTETLFVSIRKLDRFLDKRSRKLLFEPIYKTGIDHIFGNDMTEQGNGPLMPVLYGDKNDPYLRYDLDLMIGINDEARSALKVLNEAIQTVKQSVCLTTGDLLIIDNRRALHGRSPYSAKYDGTDRWLQRTKVIRDIDKAATECDKSKRIIETSTF